MSGSLTSISENVRYALQLHGRAITRLQEQAATGNRVNRGSDSPSDAYRILGLNSQDRSLASYKENVTELIGNLEISSTIITDMASELAGTRTLLTQIVGGVHDAGWTKANCRQAEQHAGTVGLAGQHQACESVPLWGQQHELRPIQRGARGGQDYAGDLSGQ